jgi:magnesium-transporting ATPase (P-type)
MSVKSWSALRLTMDENPYESPRDAQTPRQTQIDPLRVPSLVSMIVSILAIGGGMIGFVFSIILLKMLADLDRPELAQDVVQGILSSGFWFLFGVTGVFVASSIRSRKRRWLVIGWSAAALATCLLSPLAVIILMRIWRKDVWSSFNRPLVTDKLRSSGIV